MQRMQTAMFSLALALCGAFALVSQPLVSLA